MFFYAPSLTKGAIIINEISPRSDPEWVEIYNTGPETVDLSNWYLIDKAGTKKDLTSLGSFLPNTYLIFTGVKNWLNNEEEELYLYSPAVPTPIDSLTYASINENMSVARIPNITGIWFSNQIQTQGISNDISPSPSPSSSVSPSPSNSPPAAQTPTPSPSPSPSHTPTPTPTPIPPTPTPTPRPSPKPSPSPELSPPPPGTVAGESTEIDLSGFGLPSKPTSSPPITQPTLNRSRAKTALIIGSGLIILSLAGFFGYRKYRAIMDK